MTVRTTTHLDVPGQARDALEFYRSVFGGQLVSVTYAEAHSAQRPEEADTAPLEPSAWAPLHGTLTDRCGVTWVLDAAVSYDG